MSAGLNPPAPIRIPLCFALLVTLALASGCGLAGKYLHLPFLTEKPPAPPTAVGPPAKPLGFFAARGARDVIRRAISNAGGTRAWKAREGIESEMVWKTYEGARVVEDPALVQMALGWPPQIRIYYSKVDQVFALGDRGAWVTLRGQPDESPDFVARARFTAAMVAFFLSAPFNLTDRSVVLLGMESKTWGGDVFDVLTIGFRGDIYPWTGGTMALWFRRPGYFLDRCFFVSTAAGSSFGPPPNYLWILWEKYTPVEGTYQLPMRWSFFRSDAAGAMKEKLFDVDVGNVFVNRSFLPVLFRKPIIEPVIQRLPSVGPERPKSGPAIAPKYGPAITPKS